jgi:hypothetical protein
MVDVLPCEFCREPFARTASSKARFCGSKCRWQDRLRAHRAERASWERLQKLLRGDRGAS